MQLSFIDAIMLIFSIIKIVIVIKIDIDIIILYI